MTIRGSLRPVVVVCVVLAGGGCTEEKQATLPNASASAVADQEPAPAAARSNASDSEALPRVVGEVELRMARSAVEDRVGQLNCYQNAERLEVCRPVDSRRGEHGLEVFLYRGEVISLAYEVPAPKEVWTYLEELKGRYGKPSLNGLTERDRDGRLHEVYGWRDSRSLYSVRFIWQESVNQARRLIGTAITLWDRQAYAAWEKETERQPAHHSAPPPDLA